MHIFFGNEGSQKAKENVSRGETAIKRAERKSGR